MQVLGITLSPTPASSKHAALYKLGWTKTLFRVENKVTAPASGGGSSGGRGAPSVKPVFGSSISEVR